MPQGLCKKRGKTTQCHGHGYGAHFNPNGALYGSAVTAAVTYAEGPGHTQPRARFHRGNKRNPHETPGAVAGAQDRATPLGHRELSDPLSTLLL